MTTHFDVPEQVLVGIAADLITTAVEGGIGYWCSVLQYRWKDPALDGGTERDAYALVLEHEYEHEEDAVEVDVRRMSNVIRKLLTGEYPSFGNEGYSLPYARRLAGALEQVAAGVDLDATDYDFDVIDADAMFQLACFETIVYG